MHASEMLTASSTSVCSYDEECKYLRRVDATKFEIKRGFVPNMKVRGWQLVITEHVRRCAG
jgi:hypothetical protein